MCYSGGLVFFIGLCVTEASLVADNRIQKDELDIDAAALVILIVQPESHL